MQQIKQELMHCGDPVASGVRCRSLVVGLGATGLSCARFLCARGDDVVIVDNRAAPPALASLEKEGLPAVVKLGVFDNALLDQADQLVVSPGITLDEPLVKAASDRGLRVTSDIDLFCAATKAPVVAITGSNGKSTVTTLVADMLTENHKSVRAGGNLGTPALDLIENSEPDAYVLELSSFQLERTHSMAAQVACVLNVSPDHLDRYSSLNEYAQSKARIYDGCKCAVVNRNDAVASQIQVSVTTISFGLDPPSENQFGLIGAQLADEDCWLARGDNKLISVSNMAMAGRHNVANALAALAIVNAFGVVELKHALNVLTRFTGLPHRCQLVADTGGVRWIDDSKGTNVAATVAAVSGLPGPLVLIAGGIAKDADFAPLVKALAGKTRAVILLGRDADEIQSAVASTVGVHRVADMDEAVRTANDISRNGDTVLLSPACSSLDMFRSFAERGDVFVRHVRELLK